MKGYQKGHTPPNKGKPMSAEQKKKISDAHKNKKLSKEHIEKMRASKIGKKRGPPSEEHRQKLSESNLGKHHHLDGIAISTEHRIKISIGHGGNGELDKRYPNLGLWRKRNIARTPYCQFCFSEDNLEAHHIIPKSKFPQYHDEDWNCRILCRDCHKICHKQGGY
jgi:5-methylcytosine-specific restriction endonuclease McrA